MLLSEARTTNWVDQFIEQQLYVFVRPRAHSIANAEFDFRASIVAPVVGDEMVYRHVAILVPKARHAGDKPHCGNCIGAGYRDVPGAIAASDDSDNIGDPRKVTRQNTVKVFARICEHNPVPQPCKKRNTKIIFNRFDLAADGTRSHIEFGSRQFERKMPRRRFEHNE